MKEYKPSQMDEWFEDVRVKLGLVAALRPRGDYLYPLMRRVPFQDLETDLDGTILRFKAKHPEAFRKSLKDATSR